MSVIGTSNQYKQTCEIFQYIVYDAFAMHRLSMQVCTHILCRFLPSSTMVLLSYYDSTFSMDVAILSRIMV